MFGRILVEDRIRVVDVDEDFAARCVGGELREQAVGAGEREVSDFKGGPVGSASAGKFFVGPKCSVNQSDISGGSDFLPCVVFAGKGSGNEDFFAILLEQETERGILWGSGAKEFFADEIGKRTAQRNGVTDECGRFAGRFPKVAT